MNQIIKSSKFSLCILLSLILIGCSENLDDKIYKLVKNNYSNKCDFNFKQIVKEKWDYIFIFGEYFTQHDISNEIGFKYEGDETGDCEHRILIIHNNQILYNQIYNENRIVFEEEKNIGVNKIEYNDIYYAEYNSSIVPSFYFLKKK